MEVSVEGLRVLITAAGSGIGRVMARTFIEEGATVHISDIEEGLLAMGGQVKAYAAERGVSRNTLYRWMKEEDIDLAAIRAEAEDQG